MRPMRCAVVVALLAVGLGCAGGGDTAPDQAAVDPLTTAEDVKFVIGQAPDIPEGPVYGIDPRAREILDRMAETLVSAKRYTLHAETTTQEFLFNGQSVEFTAVADGAVRRPAGMWIERRTDDFTRQLYYDGNTVAIHDVDSRLYATKDVDARTNNEVLDRLAERFHLTLPLADFLVSDPAEALSESADDGIYVGEHAVRGVKCHHLAFSNDVLGWEVWIQVDGPPLPRKIVIVYRDEPGMPQFRAYLSEWNLDADVPDTRFAFVPPEGAHRIEIVPPPKLGEEGTR